MKHYKKNNPEVEITMVIRMLVDIVNDLSDDAVNLPKPLADALKHIMQNDQE